MGKAGARRGVDSVTQARHPSAFQYLRLNGTFTWWFPLVFVLFLAWVVHSRVTADPVRFSPYLFLVLLPLAAGTGLLTAARSGRFDLLFGAGLTRFRLWTFAFILAWVGPSLLAALLFAVSGVRDTTFVLMRLPAVLLFAGGISFAAGLVEMRYTFGVPLAAHAADLHDDHGSARAERSAITR